MPDTQEMGRVLMALTLSFAFLAIQLSIRPFKRHEDGTIAMITHFALVLLYLAVRVHPAFLRKRPKR
jgi:hypothetical protein